LKRNDVAGNHNSASSQRMQGDVQRNINQQNRVEQGVQSGQLTNKEASRLVTVASAKFFLSNVYPSSTPAFLFPGSGPSCS
jgi:hypothetical protein